MHDPRISSPYAPDLGEVRAFLERMIRALRFVELVSAVLAFISRICEVNSELQKKLAELRSKISAKKLSFKVGATSVSDKSIKEITGLVGEPDKKAADEQKRKRAVARRKPNLVQATMVERATPPIACTSEDAIPISTPARVAASTST